MDYADLEREPQRIKWWHRIDLGNGIVTPGVDHSSERLKELKMPDSLQGLTV
jgi:tRNA (mo5U34)-methyltransferase